MTVMILRMVFNGTTGIFIYKLLNKLHEDYDVLSIQRYSVRVRVAVHSLYNKLYNYGKINMMNVGLLAPSTLPAVRILHEPQSRCLNKGSVASKNTV